jgi:hypothetical protein
LPAQGQYLGIDLATVWLKGLAKGGFDLGILHQLPQGAS